MPVSSIPENPLRLAAWAARKACEAHVMMNLLGAVALVQLLLGDTGLVTGRLYTAISALIAAGVAGWTLLRSQARGEAEQEFAAWYRVPPGREMTFEDGWWRVDESVASQAGQLAKATQDCNR